MTVVMSMYWAGVTPEQYEAARGGVRWEEEPPVGAVLHVAWFDPGGIRVMDLWNTQADFERFVAERLMPTVREIGITGEPEVQFSPLHRRFVFAGVSGEGT